MSDRDPGALPADASSHKEGDVWWTTDEKGNPVRNEIPFGNGNQTVDQDYTDPVTGVKSHSRVTSNGQGGYSRWTDNSDGAAGYVQKDTADGVGYAQVYNPGSSTSGMPDYVVGAQPGNWQNNSVTAYDKHGNITGRQTNWVDPSGHQHVDYQDPATGEITKFGNQPDGKGGLVVTGHLNKDGQGWETDAKGKRWNVVPTVVDEEGHRAPMMWRTETDSTGTHTFYMTPHLYPEGEGKNFDEQGNFVGGFLQTDGFAAKDKDKSYQLQANPDGTFTRDDADGTRTVMDRNGHVLSKQSPPDTRSNIEKAWDSVNSLPGKAFGALERNWYGGLAALGDPLNQTGLAAMAANLPDPDVTFTGIGKGLVTPLIEPLESFAKKWTGGILGTRAALNPYDPMSQVYAEKAQELIDSAPSDGKVLFDVVTMLPLPEFQMGERLIAAMAKMGIYTPASRLTEQMLIDALVAEGRTAPEIIAQLSKAGVLGQAERLTDEEVMAAIQQSQNARSAAQTGGVHTPGENPGSGASGTPGTGAGAEGLGMLPEAGAGLQSPANSLLAKLLIATSVFLGPTAHLPAELEAAIAAVAPADTELAKVLKALGGGGGSTPGEGILADGLPWQRRGQPGGQPRRAGKDPTPGSLGAYALEIDTMVRSGMSEAEIIKNFRGRQIGPETITNDQIKGVIKSSEASVETKTPFLRPGQRMADDGTIVGKGWQSAENLPGGKHPITTEAMERATAAQNNAMKINTAPTDAQRTGMVQHNGDPSPWDTTVLAPKGNIGSIGGDIGEGLTRAKLLNDDYIIVAEGKDARIPIPGTNKYFEPDFIVVKDGKIYFVESKWKGGTYTPNQIPGYEAYREGQTVLQIDDIANPTLRARLEKYGAVPNSKVEGVTTFVWNDGWGPTDEVVWRAAKDMPPDLIKKDKDEWKTVLAAWAETNAEAARRAALANDPVAALEFRTRSWALDALGGLSASEAAMTSALETAENAFSRFSGLLNDGPPLIGSELPKILGITPVAATIPMIPDFLTPLNRTLAELSASNDAASRAQPIQQAMNLQISVTDPVDSPRLLSPMALVGRR